MQNGQLHSRQKPPRTSFVGMSASRPGPSGTRAGRGPGGAAVKDKQHQSSSSSSRPQPSHPTALAPALAPPPTPTPTPSSAIATAATTRIDAGCLTLPRPLDGAAVIGLLDRLQREHPAAHEALLRSDDIIGHAESMLFTKQAEVDRCVVVSNQLVHELSELTRQHKELTAKCAQLQQQLHHSQQRQLHQGEAAARTMMMQPSSPARAKRAAAAAARRHASTDSSENGHGGHEENDDDDNDDDDNSRAGACATDLDRARAAAKQHASNNQQRRRHHHDAVAPGAPVVGAVLTSAAPPPPRHHDHQAVSTQLQRLSDRVVDLIRTMDRFHASQQQQHQAARGSYLGGAAAPEPAGPTAPADRLLRTLWNSASTSVREMLAEADPKLRLLLAVPPTLRGGGGGGGDDGELIRTGIDPQQLAAAASSRRQRSNDASHHNNDGDSPNSAASSNKDALLRAAMLELEYSDALVAQLLARADLVEQEMALCREDADRLRLVVRTMEAESAASASAEAQRHSALDECRASLERRLHAVEADRDRLLEGAGVGPQSRRPSVAYQAPQQQQQQWRPFEQPAPQPPQPPQQPQQQRPAAPSSRFG